MASVNGQKVNNAKLLDLQTLIQAGIDPKTGLPLKASAGLSCELKNNIRKVVRVMDEQDAIHSIKWYNLPNSLDANLIERILYYKGQGMFFYMESNDKFYFLPYALDGGIDVYGRFTSVVPLPFNGSTSDNEKVKPWIPGLKRRCIYDIQGVEDLTKKEALDNIKNGCVLLTDYCKQISQTNISRQVLNDPLIDTISEMIPFTRTAVLNNTGVTGMRVGGEDDYQNVEAASRAIDIAALNGRKFIPIVGMQEFQEMTNNAAINAEDFLEIMQSLNNFRLSTHGLDNGGLFQKKAHMLQTEQDLNTGSASNTMQDRLYQRQHFCDIVNSVWGLGIWCDIGEASLGVDQDMDGELYENDPESVSTTSSDGGMND